MLYRPEFALSELRGAHVDEAGKMGSQGTLLLRWLRSLVIDCSDVPEVQQEAVVTQLIADHERFVAPRATQCVVLRGLMPALLGVLPLQHTVVRAVHQLHSLHLGSCNRSQVNDEALCSVAAAHPGLQRLCIPRFGEIRQSTLDGFVCLEELDISWLKSDVTNVDFCSATLRVLYASFCRSLTDVGLRRATLLTVLHVEGCDQVTSLAPFAHRLLELNASDHCGVPPAEVEACHRLQVLHYARCRKLSPRLRELHAWYSKFGDDVLEDATGLIALNVANNSAVTTVAPFGASLRFLDVSAGFLGISIGDEGLQTATNLVSLRAESNQKVRSLLPFASTLLELSAEGELSGITDASLAAASPALVCLEVSGNGSVTTVDPCAATLRHLVCKRKSGLTDKGMQQAGHLVTLDCSENPNLTTVAPFAQSLEELRAASERCALHGNGLRDATRLREIVTSAVQYYSPRFLDSNTNIDPVEHLEGIGFAPYSATQNNVRWVRTPH